MKDSWVERHLVPLENSDPNFEIKKQQCKMIVVRMIRGSTHPGSVAHFQKVNRREVRLQTEDGKIGGYIDAIISTDRGEVIEDFKTGSIFEPGQEGPDSLINRQYELQLKLYAALFNSTYSKWPASLEMVGLDGTAHSVEFTPEECLSLLMKAYHLLEEVNLVIIKSKSELKAAYKQLSSPSTENCRFCPYRPGCPSYWEAKDADPSGEWPNDVKGQIIEMKTLGNGLIFIKLLRDNSEIISIKGFHPDRHPVLEKKPNRIAIFSMIANKVKNSYKEGKYTTIYALN